VAALERIGHAMRLLLWDAVKGRGLSPVQAQILVHIQGHEGRLCRVGDIAREFGLTPATVSDSVRSLESKGLLQRTVWQSDARAATLSLTERGAEAARELENWAGRLRGSVADLLPEEKEAALVLLMDIIRGLQERGVVTVARMCITCRFFRRDQHPGSPAPHHCELLDVPLAASSLRVDCPDYEPLAARN